jgi:signal transduction histidine kinase
VPHGDRIVNIEIHRFGTSGDIVVLEDVTEKVAAREQINRNQRLALIGNMLAQVTHEIRNPLNAMSLNVEMLSDEPLSELGQEMLSIIQTEIARLEESTHRYLSLSRSPDVTLEQIDPSDIVNGLIQYEGQGLTFNTSGDSAMVTVDSNILRRCLRNLFRNATEAGCQQISIRYRTSQNTLHIEISNDGIPMIPEEQSKVFEPFFTTKAQGTGLGLAICKQELEYFKATLELLPNSTTTTFQITIPRFTP